MRRAIVTGVAVVAVVLTGCTPDLPEAAVTYALEETSSITDAQITRVMEETFAELALADFALDPALLTTRVGGDAAVVRAAQYLMVTADEDVEISELPAGMQAVYVSDTETWPRVIVGVSEEPEGGFTPVVMVWIQDDISTPYQLRHWAHMVPGASMPVMANTSQGSAHVALGENGTEPSPRAVLESYVELLREGPTSERDDEFAPDGYRERLFAAREALTQASKDADGTYIDTIQPRMGQTIALRTVDGGTLILAPLEIASSFSVKNATVSVPDRDKPLVEGTLTTKVTHYYLDFIVIHVPGPGSGKTLPAVVAAEHHLVSVSGG